MRVFGVPSAVLLCLLCGWKMSSPSAGAVLVPEENCAVILRAFRNLLHSYDACLFVSMDHIDCPIYSPNTSVFSISLDQMFGGLVLAHQRTANCDRVLGFFENFNVFRYFIRDKDLKLLFKPFTKIVILTLADEGFDGIMDTQVQKQAIMTNGLFFTLARILNATHYMAEDAITENRVIFDDFKSLDKGFVENRMHLTRHPLFNTRGQQFNVSLFHCPPHVIKLDDRQTLDSYEGAEIRFLKEISKGWKVNIFDRTYLFEKSDAWEVVAEDVEMRRTTMGMCSMWMRRDKYERLDLSMHFSHLCGTFLVPKPVQVAHASYIYLPLSDMVWVTVLVEKA